MNSSLRFAAFCLVTGISCPAAIASELPELQSARLMPLETRKVGEMGATNNLDSVATSINDNLGGSDSPSEGLLDPQNIPIIRDMLDEEGNVTLPLGVRVYDTMGDVSIGFGSDF